MARKAFRVSRTLTVIGVGCEGFLGLGSLGGLPAGMAAVGIAGIVAIKAWPLMHPW